MSIKQIHFFDFDVQNANRMPQKKFENIRFNKQLRQIKNQCSVLLEIFFRSDTYFFACCMHDAKNTQNTYFGGNFELCFFVFKKIFKIPAKTLAHFFIIFLLAQY